MPVCITGMHRSGTSMVAKLLSESGVHLGPAADIMPAADQNPEGFWENLKFVELNDELLARLGGGWDCPPSQPDWTAPAVAALVPVARELVASLADVAPWGWKDPRTCLTLPFWRAVVPDLRTVIVVRNPLEVARSLRERNGFSYPLGLALWYRSYQELLRDAPPGERLVTHYDAYYGAPDHEYARLVTFAEVPPLPAAVDQMRQERAGRLRHHRYNRADLAAAGAQPALLALYDELLAEAGWADDATSDQARLPLPALTDHDLSAFDTLGLGLGTINRLVVEGGALRNSVDRLQVDVDRRDAHIAKMHAILQAQSDVFARAKAVEQELVGLRRTVQAQAATIAQTQAELGAARAYESTLRAALVAAHEQLSFRDAEVMATLGIALATHSPEAPAAIYYRDLLRRVRALVGSSVPAGEAVAIAAWGDPAMLSFDGHPTVQFPAAEDGLSMRVTDDNALIDQELARLRDGGVDFLVVPASAWSWAARFHLLNPNSPARLPVAAEDDGAAVLYDLRRWTANGSAAGE